MKIYKNVYSLSVFDKKAHGNVLITNMSDCLFNYSKFNYKCYYIEANLTKILI